MPWIWDLGNIHRFQYVDHHRFRRIMCYYVLAIHFLMNDHVFTHKFFKALKLKDCKLFIERWCWFSVWSMSTLNIFQVCQRNFLYSNLMGYKEMKVFRAFKNYIFFLNIFKILKSWRKIFDYLFLLYSYRYAINKISLTLNLIL